MVLYIFLTYALNILSTVIGVIFDTTLRKFKSNFIKHRSSIYPAQFSSSISKHRCRIYFVPSLPDMMHLLISFVHLRASSFSYHPWLASSSSSGRSNALCPPPPRSGILRLSLRYPRLLFLLFRFSSLPRLCFPDLRVPSLLIRVSTSAYDDLSPLQRDTHF